MRFRIAIAGALAAGLAAAPIASALGLKGPPQGPQALVGINPQHAGLQVALRAQGLYLGPIDGIIGPHTLAAVRAFQRTHGLHVNGIADERTRRAMGPLGRPLFGSRTLTRGAFGWDVAVLQFLLNRQGLRVPVNAYMDAPTVRGLRRYQRRLHVAADGVAGPATFTALGIATRIPVKKPAVVVIKLKPYVVKPGDSLIAIARRAHVSLAKLAHLNKLDPAHVLLIGTKLRLPAAETHHASPSAVSATNASAVRDSLDRWATHYGVDPHLAHALAWMESGYNNAVVSNVGAQGVMQLLPTTWDYVETVLIGHRVRHDADGNVHVGMAYLHHLLQAFGGDEKLALAAWYQGERSVKKTGPLEVSKVFVADVLALKTRM